MPMSTAGAATGTGGAAKLQDPKPFPFNDVSQFGSSGVSAASAMPSMMRNHPQQQQKSSLSPQQQQHLQQQQQQLQQQQLQQQQQNRLLQARQMVGAAMQGTFHGARGTFESLETTKVCGFTFFVDRKKFFFLFILFQLLCGVDVR